MTDNSNVVFLDIDGVLNSVAYDRERTDKDGNIDVSRFVLLRQIVDATDAQIVLSSSWREHWEPEDEKCDQIGKELNRLDEHPNIANYVILDDAFGGWGQLESHLVRTNSRIGKGLEDKHVDVAIHILKRT